MSTTYTLHGGVRVIGGTKVLIETDHARLLLDIGLDLPEGPDLYRSPVMERPSALADRLRTGDAPRIPGIYAPELLTAVGPGAASLAPLASPDPRPSAIVLSHAHIDHDGLLPYVSGEVPVLAHPDTVALHRALEASGFTPPGTAAHLTPLAAGQDLVLGDLVITLHRVDHDVPGAVGVIVRAPEGVLAYTGDINLHRAGGVHSRQFVAAAQGARVLVCETTTLSFDGPPRAPRSETDIADLVTARLTAAPDALHLLSAYERDVERADLLIRTAASAGRRLVWPARQAALFALLGLESVVTWDDSRSQRDVQEAARRTALAHGAATVGFADVTARPGGYLVHPDPADMPALLDLPLGPGSVWLHSQGEPLGPYTADWAVWHDWLAHLDVEPVDAGSSGHAGPDDVRTIVEGIAPGRVVAIHGFHPERLEIPGVPVTLPETGVAYPL